MTLQEFSESIKDLGIYDLRELGRIMGVASPTSKKRDDLTLLIWQNINGEKSVEKKSQRGRKPLLNSRSNLLYDYIIPQEIKKKAAELQPTRNLTALTFNDSSFDKILPTFIMGKGIVRCTKEGNLYFINQDSNSSKKIVYLQNSIVKGYKIDEGDYVCGEGITFRGHNYSLLTEIKSINNVSINSLPQTVDINEVDIKMGDRTLLPDIHYGDAVIYETLDVENTARHLGNSFRLLKEKDIQPIVLASTLMPADAVRYKNEIEDDARFFTLRGETIENVKMSIDDAYNHAISLAKFGKDVVLYCIGFDNIIHNFDLYYSWKGSPMSLGHTVETLTKVQGILALARKLKKGNTITVVCFKNQDFDEFTSKELSLIPHKVLTVKV